MYDNLKLTYVKQSNEQILQLNNYDTFEKRDKNGNSYLEISPIKHPDILKEMKVTEFLGRLNIQISSLGRIYHGHSFNRLSLPQARTCLENIADLFNLKLNQLQVTNLEFGGNIELEKKIPLYIRHLALLSKHKRSSYKDETVTFSTQNRDYMFYDKINKAKSKRYYEPIPEQFKQKNILRIELKIHAPTKQFKRKIFTSDLLDKGFYISLCDLWYQYFQQIISDKETIENPLYESKSKKNFKEMLIAMGIQSLGLEKVLAAYECLKDEDAFNYANQTNYYVLKKELIEIYNLPIFNDSILLSEVNSKMSELNTTVRKETD